MATEIHCRECGGDGGYPATHDDPTEHPRAWQSCYHCGETGKCEKGCPRCDLEEIERAERAAAAAYAVKLEKARFQVDLLTDEEFAADQDEYADWAAERYAESGGQRVEYTDDERAYGQASGERLERARAACIVRVPEPTEDIPF